MARKLSVIALVLVVLYALAGFVILPWWLERAIPDRLDRHMGWQATIESVQVNPFTMSIEAFGLSADDGDGEPVLAFDRLYINVGFLRLFTGVVALEAFELGEPFARVDLREDYTINFSRDWAANNPTADDQPEAESESEQSEPVKLFLNRLRVAGGEILFRDLSKSEPEEFQISPLDLALNDLATWPREDSESDYYLLAAIGDQTVEWEGDLSIVPLYSAGSLRIADVSYTTLSHFLKPYLPYSLRDGRLTVTSDYEMRSGKPFSLSTSGGEVTLSDVALAMSEDSETELFRSGNIRIPDIEFGLVDRELSLGTVTAEDILLGLERDEEGVLNLLRPFRNEGSDEGKDDPQTDSDDSPFYWSVAGVELKKGKVNWLDRQPAKEVDLSLEQLDLTVGRLSHELAEPVDYQAELGLAAGGRATLQGQTTLQPFTLEAGISVADLNLAQVDPYVGDATNLSLRDGLLSLDGNLDLDNQQDPMTGTFSGTGQIASLDARLADSDAPLIGWQTLRLEPLEYNLAPARLEIGTLTLSNPNVNVVREQDGMHNFARIMPESGAEPSEGEEPSADSSAETAESADSKEFIFRIGQVMLEQGEVSYADRTMDPVFSTRIDRLRGTVTGLSNVAPQQGKVSIKGRLGDTASVAFDGSVGTLGTDDVSNLVLKLDDLSLPELSPYLGQYLGYGVRSGSLDLNLNYQITGTRLDADNNIILEGMELGDVVASEQAVDAPVKLGLALLRDGNNVINIDLPIQGDLGDPQFSIAPVVMRTFVGLVVRAATSPFSMLGSLADMTGLTGEELRYISFEPGKVKAASGSEKKLEALSKALEKRPSLLLKVRGAVSPEVDGNSLRRERLAEELGISELGSAEERIARLESRYQDAGLDPSLAAYREEIGGAEGAPDDRAWEKALVNRLISRVELPSGALDDLAGERGVWLKETMQEDFAVPEDQLVLLEPIQKAGQDDRGAVMVNFELEPR